MKHRLKEEATSAAMSLSAFGGLLNFFSGNLRRKTLLAASYWQAEGIMRADVDKPKSKLKRKAELGTAQKHAVPADTAEFSNSLLPGIPGENDLLW
jgi:hypothetical protein